MPFSRNSQYPQYLSSQTGTRSSTRLGGTRSTPNTCLPRLGRGHRHVSALPPPLRRQHRWPRSHPRTRATGWLHTPHRLASTNSTPTTPDLQSDPPPPTAPFHPTTPDVDVQAAAAHLSNTLPNYSHSDWEQAQREYCLFATTSQLTVCS